jgi:hypothetical protein
MSDKYIIYDPAEFDKIEIKPVENSDEITRLRAGLAAVTAERDRMRELIKGINAMLEISCETLGSPAYNSLDVGQRHSPLSQKEIIQRLTETCSFVRADLSKTMDTARAALEGVTDKKGAGKE